MLNAENLNTLYLPTFQNSRWQTFTLSQDIRRSLPARSDQLKRSLKIPTFYAPQLNSQARSPQSKTVRLATSLLPAQHPYTHTQIHTDAYVFIIGEKSLI